MTQKFAPMAKTSSGIITLLNPDLTMPSRRSACGDLPQVLREVGQGKKPFSLRGVH
jgi:hypothetical protein